MEAFGTLLTERRVVQVADLPRPHAPGVCRAGLVMRVQRGRIEPGTPALPLPCRLEPRGTQRRLGRCLAAAARRG